MSDDDSLNPSMAMDSDGNIHVAWEDYSDYSGSGTDRDIFYRRWNATTASWSTIEVVSSAGSTNDSFDPSLAVDVSGNVHVAWWELTGLNVDVLYRRWNATSGSWSTTEVVSTENTNDSYSPTLALDGAGNAHVAWTLFDFYLGEMNIYYKRWNATTNAWTVAEEVTTETSFCETPSLTVDGGGNVHVAWQDHINYGGSGTDLDIFYKRWNPTTDTWTTTEVVSTQSTSASIFPTLAADVSGNVHAAWYDSTDYSSAGTDYDIFYKRWNATSGSWTTTEV
ncbi:MAG: hypothetical protein JW839_12590, partial [Candidatus Lokiarchaeota archaeon]|nr:hypothetical protein [Candidatus Lokiarchaeota archaeon]